MSVPTETALHDIVALAQKLFFFPENKSKFVTIEDFEFSLGGNELDPMKNETVHTVRINQIIYIVHQNYHKNLFPDLKIIFGDLEMTK